MVTKNTLYRMLDEILLDDRFWYPSAHIHQNGPLALIQTDLEARFTQLCMILEIKRQDAKDQFKSKGRFANYDKSISEE